MPQRTEQLQPASFRGIPFFVRSETQEVAGNNLILHEYPNSDKRFVENLGLIPEKFSMPAFVHGSDWLEQAAALENALKQKESGRLVLPTFGGFEVYADKFTKTATQQAVGEISYQLVFVLGEAATAPARAGIDIEEVFDAGDTARAAIVEEFPTIWEEIFDVSNSLVAQFDALTALQTIETVIKAELADASEFLKATENIAESIFSLTKAPQRLAQAFFSFLGDAAGLYTAVSTNLKGTINSLEQITSLTRFGANLTLSLVKIKSSKPENKTIINNTDIPFWAATTIQRIRRNSNRKLFVQSVRLASLISAYEQAAAVAYTTKQEVQKARSLVEQAYYDIIGTQTYDKTAIQNKTAAKNALITVRNNALIVLEAKEQQAFGLVDLDSQVPISSYLLSYQLYAESFTESADIEERKLLLRGLNPAQNNAAFVGEYDVFQAG